MASTTELCRKCKRQLIELSFDKCMYCGEALPEHLKLSDEEKKKEIEIKQQNYKQSRKKHENYMKSLDRKSADHDEAISFFSDFGGDGGD